MRKKYLDRIEVWLRGTVDDGAGGFDLDDTKLSDSWCNITTVRRDKLIDYGLDVSNQAIEIRLRYRDDLDYFQESVFFKYKGKDWIINAIDEINLDGRELSILASSK